MKTAVDLPEQFGKYRIEKKIGQGGMGSVWLARDSQLGRTVALKVPHVADDADALQRFYREARAASAIQHPNLCPIYDLGEVDGLHYLAMAYITGKPLSAYTGPEQRWPVRQAVQLVRRLALALQEAHDQGIIHRDLKPSNIMIDQRNEPIVMDFGLARRLESDSTKLTADGTVMGTPAYMSPEQARGEVNELGPPADVYSLTVILYELLCGRAPYEGSLHVILGKVLFSEPPPATEFRPDLDAALVAVLNKGMAKDAAARYPSMTALAEDLARYLDEERPGQSTMTPRAEPTGEAPKVPRAASSAAETQPPEPARLTPTVPLVQGRPRNDSATVPDAPPPPSLGGRLARTCGHSVMVSLGWGWRGRHLFVDRRFRAWAWGVIGLVVLAGVLWFSLGGDSSGPLLTLKGQIGNINAVAFSPDGERVAAASAGTTLGLWHGKVRVWDARNGAALYGPLDHAKAVRAVAFSPDGRWLASGGRDRTIHVWQAKDGTPAATLKEHTDEVAGLAFHPTRPRLASAGADGVVRVWDTENWKPLLSHDAGGALSGVAYSPDGRWLAAGGKGLVKLWDDDAVADVHAEVLGPVAAYGVAFSPDGRLLAAGCSDHRVRLWEVPSWGKARMLEEHEGPVNGVAFDRNGRLASVSDTMLVLWDPAAWRPLHTRRLHRNTGLKGVAFGADGRRLAAGGHDDAVRIWDVTPKATE